MKRIVLAFLLTLFSFPALAAISGTIRQSQTDVCGGGQWGGASCQVTLSGASLSANDLIVVVWSYNNDSNGLAPVLPSEGGYTQSQYYTDGTAGALACSVAWKKAAGTETTITPSFSATTNAGRVLAVVFSGTDLSLTAIEAENESTANIASADTSGETGAATNGTANALAIGVLCTDDHVDTANNVTAWADSELDWSEQAEAATNESYAQIWVASGVAAASAEHSTVGTITSDQSYGAILVFGGASGSCPATCAGGRTGVCITNTGSDTDPDNILYGQSPAVASGGVDTVCHDATSDILSDAVTVSTSGWVTFASNEDIRTDDIDYCIMDAGAACGTDGTFQVTQTPVLSGATGTATGTNTADLSVTVDQVEGTVYTCVQASSVANPSHAQIAAGNNGAGAACTYSANDATPAAAQTFSATGLTAGTSYEACYGQANAATTPLTATVVCSDAFITTASGDTTPDAFAFNDLIEVTQSNQYLSNELAITGINAAAVVGTDGCEWRKYSSNTWSAWSEEFGTIANNELLQLRFVVSSSEQSDTLLCTIVVGGVADSWSVTTAFDPTVTTARDFAEWFYNQPGYTGGANGRMSDFLADQGYTGPLNSALFDWLRSLGYTGSLTTMIDAFERDVTIQHGN